MVRDDIDQEHFDSAVAALSASDFAVAREHLNWALLSRERELRLQAAAVLARVELYDGATDFAVELARHILRQGPSALTPEAHSILADAALVAAGVPLSGPVSVPVVPEPAHGASDPIALPR